MDTRTAKGWRWAANTMKVFGVIVIVKLFFAFKSNQFKGLVESAMLLLVGFAFAGIAFLLGWLSANGANSVPVTESQSGDSDIGGLHSPRGKSHDWAGGLLLIGMVVAGVMGWVSSRSPAGQHINPRQNPAPDLATATAEKLNKGLPRMTSQYVRFESVTAAPESALIYDYTFVGWPKMNPMDQQTSERFRALTVAATCASNDKDLLDRGISLRSRYRRPDGKLIADITVVPADCGQAP